MNNWNSERMTLHVAVGNVADSIMSEYIGGKEGNSYTIVTAPELYDAAYYVVANDYGLSKETILRALSDVADHVEFSGLESWLTKDSSFSIDTADGSIVSVDVHTGVHRTESVDIYVTYLED